MAKRAKVPEVSDDLLGPIEQLVLTGVVTLGDEAYGMSVFEAIRTVYPPISFGSVYTALERLTWKGYLESRLGAPEPTRGGRARKYYRETGLGKKVLESTRRVLQSEMLTEPTAA